MEWTFTASLFTLARTESALQSTDPLSRSISRLGQAFWQRFAVADCLECADYALQRQCESQQSHSSEYWQPHCSPARLCISKTIFWYETNMNLLSLPSFHTDSIPLHYQQTTWFESHIFSPLSFSHYYQGKIDESTVNTNFSSWMYFLIHPQGWINDERMAITVTADAMSQTTQSTQSWTKKMCYKILPWKVPLHWALITASVSAHLDIEHPVWTHCHLNLFQSARQKKLGKWPTSWQQLIERKGFECLECKKFNKFNNLQNLQKVQKLAKPWENICNCWLRLHLFNKSWNLCLNESVFLLW